jgi:C-terminal processing protease CtpA/Prc
MSGIELHDVLTFVRWPATDRLRLLAFHAIPSVSLGPSAPHYDGKVVILVDETTQSSAEYHAMALQATPNAVVVGSTTAGADGNVSWIALPGGFKTLISGLGVFYPNGSPTQRVGIRVDVDVSPSIAGIRDGRDEVLESAIRQIIPELSEPDVEHRLTLPSRATARALPRAAIVDTSNSSSSVGM